MNKLLRIYKFVIIASILSIPTAQSALADEIKQISTYEHEWDYYSDSQYKASLFESRQAQDGTPREKLNVLEDPDSYAQQHQSDTTRFVSNKEIQDVILDKIPFGSDLKSMWHFVDGDTDIIFTGLRADRRNKGLTYKTQTLPIVGEMNDIELSFSAGDDNEVSFTTHTIPLMGKLDGFSFKATASDNSKVFARYTVPFKYD